MTRPRRRTPEEKAVEVGYDPRVHAAAIGWHYLEIYGCPAGLLHGTRAEARKDADRIRKAIARAIREGARKEKK